MDAQTALDKPSRQLVGNVARSVGDDNRRAGFGEARHDRGTNTAASAGYQGDLFRKIEWFLHHTLRPLRPCAGDR